MKLLFIVISITFIVLVPEVPGITQISAANAAKPVPKNRIRHKFNKAAKPKQSMKGKSSSRQRHFNAQARPKPRSQQKMAPHFNAAAKPKLKNKKGKADNSSPENVMKGPIFKPPSI